MLSSLILGATADGTLNDIFVQATLESQDKDCSALVGGDGASTAPLTAAGTAGVFIVYAMSGLCASVCV